MPLHCRRHGAASRTSPRSTPAVAAPGRRGGGLARRPDSGGGFRSGTGPGCRVRPAIGARSPRLPYGRDSGVPHDTHGTIAAAPKAAALRRQRVNVVAARSGDSAAGLGPGSLVPTASAVCNSATRGRAWPRIVRGTTQCNFRRCRSHLVADTADREFCSRQSRRRPTLHGL